MTTTEPPPAPQGTSLPGLTVTSLADRPELLPELEDLYDRGWPAFMSADPVDIECWPQLLELAPHLQLAMLDDDRVIATAHAVPLDWDPSQELAQEGWDWGFAKGIADVRAGRPTEAACALAITIESDRRGGGVGITMLNALRDQVRRHGGRWLVGPLRPSGKSAEPMVPFREYIARVRDDGLPSDPWLRSHVRVGARVGAPCERSMTITASVTQWEEWSGIPHQVGLPYIVPSALIPVAVDEGVGRYVEPNIWVIHDL